jgi:hypothetical protein
MRKPYFTKKKKREFDLTYQRIAELKKSIGNMKLEAQVFLNHRNFPEAKARFEMIDKLKSDLKELAKAGWDTSSFCFILFLIA